MVTIVSARLRRAKNMLPARREWAPLCCWLGFVKGLNDITHFGRVELRSPLGNHEEDYPA